MRTIAGEVEIARFVSFVRVIGSPPSHQLFHRNSGGARPIGEERRDIDVDDDTAEIQQHRSGAIAHGAASINVKPGTTRSGPPSYEFTNMTAGSRCPA